MNLINFICASGLLATVGFVWWLMRRPAVRIELCQSAADHEPFQVLWDKREPQVGDILHIDVAQDGIWFNYIVRQRLRLYAERWDFSRVQVVVEKLNRLEDVR